MLKLLGNKVAIQAHPDPDISPGGIIIPDIAKDRTDQGVVKYVGPDVKTLKPGDYVLYGGYDGQAILMEGEGTLILMREDWVKCVIKDIDSEVSGLYLKLKPPFNLAGEVDFFIQSFIDAHGLPQDKPYNDLINIIITKVGKYISEVYQTPNYETAVQLITESVKTISHMNPNMIREDPTEDVD